MFNDSKKLIEELSTAWDISEDQQNVLLSNTTGQRASETPPTRGETSRYAVGIATVSTFVARKNLSNFVVPSFAAHWGIVCDFERQSRMLYHLSFNPETRVIRFKAESWEPEWNKHQVKQIGTSLYGHPEIHATGNHLLSHSILMLISGYRRYTPRRICKAWELPLYLLELSNICEAFDKADLPKP